MDKKKINAAFALLAAAGSPSFAGTNAWTQVSDDGGQLSAVEYLQGQVALAGGNTGIYRTENDGQSWTRVLAFRHRGYTASIAVNPSNTSEILVASNKVYRSTDGGRTFTDIELFPNSTNTATAVAFSRDGTVAWLGLNLPTAQIRRSTDGGRTWEVRSSGFAGSDVRAFDVDAVDNNVAYALTDLGRFLHRTVDGGMSWTLLDPTKRYLGVTASPLTPDFVLSLTEQYPFRSVDRGTTWMQSTFPFHYLARYSPNTAGRIFAIGQGQGSFTSTDDGLMWISRMRLPIAHARSLSISPADNNRVLVATPLGIAATADDGLTWSTPNTGMKELAFASVIASTDGSGRMYATAYDVNTLYSRDPATGRWTGVGAQAKDLFGIPSRSPFAIAVHPTDSKRVYLSRGGRFGVSTDGGVTWSDVGLVQAVSLTIDPSNPDALYAATQSGGVRKTIDGGANWNDASSGLPAGVRVTNVTIDPAHPNVLYASTGGLTAPRGVYKSVDAGLSWLPANTGIENRIVSRVAIDPRTSTLYAGSTGGPTKSVDGGATWNKVLPPNLLNELDTADVVVDTDNPGGVYMLWPNHGDVVRSVGSAQRWEYISRPEELSFATSMTLVPGRPGVMTVSTDAIGLQEYTIAPDLEIRSNTSALALDVAQLVALHVANNGPHAASNVTLAATLPAGATTGAIQPSTGSCQLNGSQLACSFDALMSGESVDIPVSFTSMSGSGALSASVRAYESDPVAANNEISLAIQRWSDVQMTSFNVPSRSAFVGNRFTYSLAVMNVGPSPATSVRATVQLAANVQFESATSGTGSCSAAAGTVSCALGTLGVNASSGVTINVTAASAGPAVTLASVTSDGTDPVPANNSLSSNIDVSASSGGGGGGGGGRFDLFWLAALFSLRVVVGVLKRGRSAGRIQPGMLRN